MSVPLVLISDDDTLLAHTMVRAARSAGLRAFSDTTSRAPDLAVRYHPDVVLLDVGQSIDGRELLAELKRDKRTKDIPVVMVSGNTDEDVKRACLELGATEWVAKPFPPAFFQRLAKQVCTEKDAHDAEPHPVHESAHPSTTRVVIVGAPVGAAALHGCTVVHAETAHEALDLCKRERAHVLVCEEPIEGPGGVELVLRARAACKQLRGVVLADASQYFKASQLDLQCGCQMLLRPASEEKISDAVNRAARLSLGRMPYFAG